MFFAGLTGTTFVLSGTSVTPLYGQSTVYGSQLAVWGVLVVVVQLLDYITPVLGSKYGGGSKWGSWGCMIGTIAGIFIFPPWGILFGPFAGAVIGELLGGKKSFEAFKAGIGAFAGFLLSVVAKISLCGYFVYLSLIHI